MDLMIDQEFADKIPPLTKEELEQLEANILADGVVINPLIVWNGMIVDGHNRYRILQMHPEIPYQTHEKEFSDRYEVIAWICKNQLGRRNLTPEQKRILIGTQYKAEKSTHGGKRIMDRDENGQFTARYQNDTNGEDFARTRDRIASENGVSSSTVTRAEQYLDGIEAAEEAVPGIRQEILSGKIKAPEKAVAAIARASPDDRKELVENLRNPRASARGQPITESADPVLEDEGEGLDEDTDEETESYVPSKASIRQISAAMASDAEHPEHRMPTEFIIEELTDALDSMIFRWDFVLGEHPDEAGDKECRRQIQLLVEKGRAYLKLYRGGKKRDAE